MGKGTPMGKYLLWGFAVRQLIWMNWASPSGFVTFGEWMLLTDHQRP